MPTATSGTAPAPADLRRAVHELNNLLTVIGGFAELVRDGLAPGDPHRSCLQEVCRAAARAAAIGRELLDRPPDGAAEG